MKKFLSIYKMSERELKKFCAKKLKETHKSVAIGDGYVFAKGTIPVLLVAHLDTVHKNLPTTFRFEYDKNGKVDCISSPQGIGGDDRNGVYSVLQIVQKYNCSVLFCEQEEIGGVGAEKFTESELAKELEFNYMIELDRQGSNDAVFYNCDNQEFEEFITRDFYKTAFGTFSDISILAPHFGCAAVNLSCGYYKAHTTSEFIVLSEMQDSINAVCEILERTTESDKFEYVESYDYYSDNYSKYYSGCGGYGGEMYYLVTYEDINGKTKTFEVEAMSEFEALGYFFANNPNISFNDVLDIEEF